MHWVFVFNVVSRIFSSFDHFINYIYERVFVIIPFSVSSIRILSLFFFFLFSPDYLQEMSAINVYILW